MQSHGPPHIRGRIVMSTRSSIYYSPPVHIFEEVFSEDICIEVVGSYDGPVKVNQKYGDPVLSRDQMIEMRDALTNWLERTEKK